MAVSGSVDFTVTRTEIIEEALGTHLGILGEGVSASADQLTRGARALNIMLKAWQAYGLNVWMIRETNITPVAGQSKYLIGPTGDVTTIDRPLEILEAYRRETSTAIDTPMTKISRTQYWELSDKDSSSTPVNFYYDPQLDNGALHVWPTADSTFASNYTIKIFYRKPFDDMDSATDTLEFPSEWFEAIVMGLATRLARGYGVPLQERYELRQASQDALELALSWDTEHTSIYFQPDNLRR